MNRKLLVLIPTLWTACGVQDRHSNRSAIESEDISSEEANLIGGSAFFPGRDNCLSISSETDAEGKTTYHNAEIEAEYMRVWGRLPDNRKLLKVNSEMQNWVDRAAGCLHLDDVTANLEAHINADHTANDTFTGFDEYIQVVGRAAEQIVGERDLLVMGHFLNPAIYPAGKRPNFETLLRHMEAQVEGTGKREKTRYKWIKEALSARAYLDETGAKLSSTGIAVFRDANKSYPDLRRDLKGIREFWMTHYGKNPNEGIIRGYISLANPTQWLNDKASDVRAAFIAAFGRAPTDVENRVWIRQNISRENLDTVLTGNNSVGCPSDPGIGQPTIMDKDCGARMVPFSDNSKRMINIAFRNRQTSGDMCNLIQHVSKKSDHSVVGNYFQSISFPAGGGSMQAVLKREIKAGEYSTLVIYCGAFELSRKVLGWNTKNDGILTTRAVITAP